MVRRASIIFLELFAGLLAGFVLFAVVGAWWLSSGPIKLTFLSPYIEEALSPEDGTLAVEIDDTMLVWAGWDRAVDIRVRNLRLRNFVREELALLPDISIGLSLRALARGMIAPTSLEIISPRVTGIRDKSGQISIGFTPNEKDALAPENAILLRLLGELMSSPDPDQPFGYLREIIIKNANLALDDRMLGNTWRAPSSDIEIRRDDNGIRAAGHVDLDIDGQRSRIDGEAFFNAKTNKLHLATNFAGFDPGLLARNSDNPFWRKLAAFDLAMSGELGLQLTLGADVEAAQFNVSTRLGEFRGDIVFGADGYSYRSNVEIKNVPGTRLNEIYPELATFASIKAALDGRLTVFGTIDGRVIESEFEIELGAGDVALPKLLPRSIPIRGGQLRGRMEDDFSRFQIRDANLALDKGQAALNITGGTVGANLSVRVDGIVRDIPVDHVDQYWPQKIGTDARDWIIPNIRGGTVREARVGFVLRMQKNDTSTSNLESLNGAIQVTGATVNYFDPMPVAEQVGANMTFTKDRFDIAVTTGRLGSIKLRQGSVVITGLNDIDQYIAIDFEADGPVKDAMTLLDQKPLEFIGPFGLDLPTVSGSAAARVNLKFLLAKNLTPKDVAVGAAANLKAMTLRGFGVDLTDGDLSMAITGKGMNITGVGRLNGVPVSLNWNEDFAQAKGIVRRIGLNGNLNQAARVALNLPPLEILKGDVATKATYTSFTDGRIEIVANADLKTATVDLPAIQWRKPAGTDGSAYVFVIQNKSGDTLIEDLSVETGDMRLSARIVPSKGGGGISKAEIRNFEFAGNQMRGIVSAMDNSGYEVRLSGKQINVAPLMEGETIDMPLSIQANFDKVLFGGNKVLHNVIVSQLSRNGPKWSRIALDANLTAGQDGAKSTLKVSFLPTKNGQRLRVDSNNGGLLLQTFDWSNKVLGGQLRIEGLQAKPDSPINGAFVFNNFKVKEAPAFARVLQYASLTGIFSALGQKGLDFDSLQGRFTYNNDVIRTNDTIAKGSDLGVTIEGSLAIEKETVNMSGAVIPNYTLNQIIKSVPVIGPIMTGGEGVFAANYNITGPLGDPTVNVNPLSVLAPGLLRKLIEQKVKPLSDKDLDSSGD